MPKSSPIEIRELLLTIVQEKAPKRGTLGEPLGQRGILDEIQRRLDARNDSDLERAILAQWNDLFRTGYLGWGLNLSNPDPPFFHITDRGRSALERLSRDPGNPGGYLKYIRSVAKLNAVADSYLLEALNCFVADLHKGAAVMLGAAAESLVLELRDVTVSKLTSLAQKVPKQLVDWKAKAVLDALHSSLDSKKAAFDRSLREEFESYWLAFGHQIRTVRNDAGHPLSVEAVTHDAVHASFLVFPELARLSSNLNEWVVNKMT